MYKRFLSLYILSSGHEGDLLLSRVQSFLVSIFYNGHGTRGRCVSVRDPRVLLYTGQEDNIAIPLYPFMVICFFAVHTVHKGKKGE